MLIYGLLKETITVFVQSGGDAIILCNNMPSSTSGKVLTCIGEVLFERESPNLKQEVFPSTQIDLRVSRRPHIVPS